MAIVKARRSASWGFDFTVNGQRYRDTTDVAIRGEPGSAEYKKSKAEAAKVEAREKAKIKAAAEAHREKIKARVILGQATSSGKTVIPTLLEAIEGYIEARGHRSKNAKEEEVHFTWIVDAIGADVLVTEIDAVVVERLVAKRRQCPKLSKPRRCRKTGAMLPGKPQVLDEVTRRPRRYVEGKDRAADIVLISPAFVNRSSIDLLKRVVLRCRDVVNVPGMPGIRWRGLRCKEAGPRKRRVTRVEEAALEAHLREGYGHALRFALVTGFRLSNFVNLRLRDIDFEGRQIHLRQKGDKDHTIPMTAEVEAIIRAARAEHMLDDRVFAFRFRGARRGRGATPTASAWTNSKTGVRYEAGAWYPLTTSGFRSWFVDLTKAAGIEGLRIHDLRRTAGSRLLTNTGNLKLVQRLLGHSDVRTTASTYAHLDDADALEAMELSAKKEAAWRARATTSHTGPHT